MKKTILFIIVVLTTQITFAQPANEDCANAELITVSNTISNINFDINNAVINNETICTVTDDYADVWYQFTMPVDGNVFVDGGLGWNYFALYTSCGTAAINCDNGKGLFTALSSGNTYFLRIYRKSATAANTGYQSFGIRAIAAATNDDCNTSENISISTTTSTVNFEIAGSSITNSIGCNGTAAEDYVDVWYDFTMPFSGNIFVDAKIIWNNVALYDACGGVQIACGSSSNFFTGLSAGSNYKLRVFRAVSEANNSYLNFSIKAFENALNDSCSASQNITVSEAVSTVDFEIGGSTIINNVGCDGTSAADYVDIWYDFNMPFNGNVFVDAKIGWNDIALYDACGGAQIECGSGSKFFTELSGGTNYKLRIFRPVSDVNNSYLDFTIKGFEEAINDECNTSENIAVSTDETEVEFIIGGASINTEEGCEGTALVDYVDLWYDFTMPVNGNIFVDAAIGWNNIALYDACGGQQLQCGSANELISGLTTGTDYKLRIYRTLSNVNNAYTGFSIRAYEIINNDDCASAESITITDTATTVHFGITGADRNNEVGCSGTTMEDYADVWYEFTMPSDGDITMDGGIAWNNFAVYSTCDGVELGCFEGQGGVSNLTTGTTYKLRVFRTSALANNDGYKSFTIQRTSVPLHVKELELEKSISIYPNPTSSMLLLSSTYAIKNIKMFNLLGKQVLDNKKDTQINLSTFNSGMYLLKIKTDKGESTKKVIKI
ncbi:T9SS type A sorting domain-containing protein [Algibacter amylolyticus]|uniref:T9SS type A sorting domain-containing protein n=1 Tax=Algibacter amylolyticus TaxID=1608400 RepID=A0A5M7BH94_9FLAO|nr:T9SS type A sorting domain-containing protein [Algibacter amylolyticus]KAA5827737.1 T9SS type A sorting domain-containing protein [Algibacter amylolyticus]MBB5266959.1 hypothetical protein [Algibacter amylolyticus]TSJ81982.1 T9SS type A sorting domain-containing protein [Algibacter amylolyticus]